MAAKDWAPLRNTLWQHVRVPLRRGHPEEWDGVEPGDTISFARLRSLANGGRISATDTRSAVLWYALVYGCPHFDALSALMAKREFRELDLQVLSRLQKHTRHRPANALAGILCRGRSAPLPRLLHVDFGCGPGTASWAIIKILSGHFTLMTIGHDHNRYMTRLARRTTRDISDATQHIRYRFSSNWTLFEALVKWLATRSYDTVIVTVNSLFGQHSVGDDDIERIVSLIAAIRDRAQESSIFAIGTHPPYEADRVAAAWQRIADLSGRDVRYNGRVSFNSWNPIRSGDYAPGDGSAWSMWRGQPQLGHIIEVRS